MKTSIKNIILCKGAIGDTLEFIENAQINIENNIIKYAGPKENVSNFKADKTIDGKGMLAMPAMINLHTHNPMTLLRGVGGNLCLEDWLNLAIFPREKKLTDESVEIGSLLGIMEMLRFGTANYCDMYMHMDAQAKIVEKYGMRASLGFGAVHLDNGYDDFDEGLDFAKRWNNKANGRIKTLMAPHSTYLADMKLLEKTAKHAKEMNLSVHIHVSETQTEVQTVINKYGATPPFVLKDAGILDNKVVAAHCVWLNDEDISMLKDYDFTVAHNPISNLKLASGIADTYKLLSNGIAVGLGSDGVASNNNLNLWEEMRLFPLLQKGVHLDPKIISPAQVLKATTITGAKALGYNNLGILDEGYLADLMLIDLNTCHACPQNSLEDDLIYSLQGSDVYMTMVDGKVLYENGEYPGIDKQEIFKLAKEAARALNS